MPSPNNVLTADSYIQDGLVFQLDGIEYGGRANGWLDRKQNLFMTSNNGEDLHNGNKYSFSTGKSLSNTRIWPIGYNGTIEVVFTVNNSSKGVLFIASTGLAAYFDQLTIIGGIGSNIPKFAVNRGTHIIDLQINRVIKTGYDVPFAVGSGVYTAGAIRIGWVGAPYQFYFPGDIYAIRVYSRQLSDREILINQKIDNARFGLGLDIPDEVLPASRSLSLSEPFELPDESMTEQDITNENSDER